MASDWKQKDVRRWSTKDVGYWLEVQGLGQYKSTFCDNAIGGCELLELDEEDLVFLGLTKIGYRKKAVSCINELRQNAALASGSASEANTATDFEETASLLSLESGASSASSASRASAAPPSQLVVKIAYGSSTVRLKVSPTMSFSRFKSKVNRELGVKRARMKWRDNDGDIVNLSNDSHWADALSECLPTGTLHVEVKKSRTHGPNSRAVADCSASPQAMVLVDTKGKICCMSGAACELFGYSKLEAEGKNVKILMPEHYAREHDRYLKRYLKTLEPRVIGSSRQVTGLHRDGTQLQLELSLGESHEKNRQFFIGTFRKLRSDEKAEGDLPEMQAQFDITDNLLDACIIGDEKGHVLFFNKAAEKLLGYSRKDVVGKNVKMLMPDDVAAKHDEYVSHFVTTREKNFLGIKGRQVRARKNDGTPVDVMLTLSEQHWGKRLIITAVVRPMKAASEDRSLKDLIENKRCFLNNLPIAAVVIDEAGTVQVYNTAAFDLFGFASDKVVGQNVKVLIPFGEARDNHDSYLQRYVKTQQSKNVVGAGRQVTALHVTGIPIDIHLSVQAEKFGGKHLFTGLAQGLE